MTESSKPLAPKFGEWVSVAESLPKCRESGDFCVPCIVATEDGQVIAMTWKSNMYATTEKGRQPRWEWFGRISQWKVTHWMPLPPHPKEAR